MLVKADRDSLEEKGWDYYLSPDKLYIVRLKQLSRDGNHRPVSYVKEMFKIRPKIAVAHGLRVISSEEGYRLPDVYSKTWRKLSNEAAVNVLKGD